MSGIKRWDIAALGNGFTGMKQRDDGAFVRNADHEAEVARLRAELEKVRGYEVAPLEARVAELRAELADAHAAIESKACWEWKKEADRLRAELQNAAKAALDAVALSCEKEREADALRVDAERWRLFQTAGYNVTLRMHYTRPDEREKAIDAAMGASA